MGLQRHIMLTGHGVFFYSPFLRFETLDSVEKTGLVGGDLVKLLAYLGPFLGEVFLLLM